MVFSRSKFILNQLKNLWANSKKTEYHVPLNPAPLPEFRRLEKRPKVALVLGGGGARGVAHIAVLEELEKANIPIDLIVGCSSGSLVGALYADTPDALRVKKILHKLKKKDLVNFNFLNSRYGLGKGQGIRSVLSKSLTSKKFEQLEIPLHVVATDLKLGELVSLHTGDVIPAVHASCAVPFYFKPVVLHDRVLVDGGVINSVPTVVAKAYNPHMIIAVDLNQTLSDALPSHLFGVAKRSWEIALYHQTKQCLTSADVIIKPALGNIGMFEETHNEFIYEAGRKAAAKAVPKIKELLKGIL